MLPQTRSQKRARVNPWPFAYKVPTNLVVNLGVGIDDGAGGRIDVVVILIAIGLEVYVVVDGSVIKVKLATKVKDVGFTETRVLEGNALGLGIADVLIGGSGGRCLGLLPATTGYSKGEGKGDEAHLKSSITPCYYRSCDDDESVGHIAAKKLPRTGDPSSTNYIATLVTAGLVLMMAGLRHRDEEA